MANVSLTKSYARAIFIDGTRSFTGHNGITAIHPSYISAVKEWAGHGYVDGVQIYTVINGQNVADTGYTVEQIDNAYVLNRITEQEMTDTLAYKPAP